MAKRIASAGVRERPIGLTDRPLTHTGWESDPRGYLTDFTAKRIASHGRVRSDCIARCAWEADRTPTASQIGLTDHRFESPICEAVCVRGRAHHKVMWSVWESEVRGRPRPPTASQIWESDRPLTHTGRCSPILGAAWLISRLNALLRPSVRERPIGLSNLWGCGRPRTASHFGLTDHRSDSLTDLTMWQIWQIHFIAI